LGKKKIEEKKWNENVRRHFTFPLMEDRKIREVPEKKYAVKKERKKEIPQTARAPKRRKERGGNNQGE